jgi:hypothetical protein
MSKKSPARKAYEDARAQAWKAYEDATAKTSAKTHS